MGPAAAGRDDNPSTCIPAGAVAEYLHSVIQADRMFYTTDVVERMQMRGIAFAAENWRETSRLPSSGPIFIGNRAARGGGTKRFAIPVDQQLGDQCQEPSDDRLRTSGLTEILVNPDQPYTAVTTEGGFPVFQALYADKAASQSCIGCHMLIPIARRRISSRRMSWEGFCSPFRCRSKRR